MITQHLHDLSDALDSPFRVVPQGIHHALITTRCSPHPKIDATRSECLQRPHRLRHLEWTGMPHQDPSGTEADP